MAGRMEGRKKGGKERRKEGKNEGRKEEKKECKSVFHAEIVICSLPPPTTPRVNYNILIKSFPTEV